MNARRGLPTRTPLHVQFLHACLQLSSASAMHRCLHHPLVQCVPFVSIFQPVLAHLNARSCALRNVRPIIQPTATHVLYTHSACSPPPSYSALSVAVIPLHELWRHAMSQVPPTCMTTCTRPRMHSLDTRSLFFLTAHTHVPRSMRLGAHAIPRDSFHIVLCFVWHSWRMLAFPDLMFQASLHLRRTSTRYVSFGVSMCFRSLFFFGGGGGVGGAGAAAACDIFG
jgi:hypothetical protein